MANRDVTADAENDDKTTLTSADKFMIIDVATAPDSLKEATGANVMSSLGYLIQTLNKYRISVTVSSNNLTVALKTAAGNDPSATDPLYVRIGYTVRTVSAATSITLNAATNWMGLGGAQFATIQQELFVYLVWDSDSSVVAISCSRIPGGKLVSDFNSTNTNEKYLGNYSNFTTTDEVQNIGRFAATLSAGAGYTWTVPTFSNTNLIQEPIYETSVLVYDPTLTGFSADPTNNYEVYQVTRKIIRFQHRSGTNGTSNATTFTVGLPFAAKTVTNGTWVCYHTYTDNGSGSATQIGRALVSSADTTCTMSTNVQTGAWTGSAGKRIQTMDWMEYEY